MKIHRRAIPRASVLRRARAALVVLGMAGGALAAVAQPTGANDTPVGWVEGVVVRSMDGSAVAGATVWLPDYGVRTTSGQDGRFAFGIALPTAAPYRQISAVARAPHYGRWTIRGVPLYPNDTLRLNVELRAADWTHDVRAPSERAERGDRTTSGVSAFGTGAGTCTGWDRHVVPPRTIKVWISKESVSKTYDFQFYVEHVLPNEWIPSWDVDSLGAGAIAVKTYAWYRAMDGHAHSSGAACADLVDTVSDQVFDPSWSTLATDRAVAATFGSVLHRNGRIFLAQYYAGTRDMPCEPVSGTYAGRMAQWGTKTCADQGKLWPAITTTFYTGTRWEYRGNMLLNPAAESKAMYPWKALNGSVSRSTDGPASGSSSFLVIPKSTTRLVTLRQVRPWPGASDTSYHAATSLKCPTSNPRDCSMKLRIVGISEGKSSVYADLDVSVPNDGVWRRYVLNSDPIGKAHSSVRFAILSDLAFGADRTYVDTAFGGP